MNEVDLRECPHLSPDYLATVQLRKEVLRWPLGLDLTEEQLAAEAGDIHLGAFSENVCVGCLVLTPHGSEEVKMRQVAVHPAWQGRGIGRQMVEWSERRAHSAGFHVMVLHARETAVPFYLRLGYCLEGDPFVEVTLPHRRMLKPL